VTNARKQGGQSIVISFDQHPNSILRPGSEPTRLQSLSERSEWLAALGVDIHLVIPFTKEFAELSPETFVYQLLLSDLSASEIMIGYNFRFGKGRKGTPKLLEMLCSLHGVIVKVASPVYLNNEVISSTLIRAYLSNGQVETAATLLGRPAVISGHVKLQTVIKAEQAFSYEFQVDRNRQVPGPGEYFVEICNESHPLCSNSLLKVERIDGKDRCYLRINEGVTVVSSQYISLRLIQRINNFQLEGNPCKKVLIHDSSVMPAVNS
jgi:riboflavin kinase/FMN adenylyltransferase